MKKFGLAIVLSLFAVTAGLMVGQRTPDTICINNDDTNIGMNKIDCQIVGDIAAKPNSRILTNSDVLAQWRNYPILRNQ